MKPIYKEIEFDDDIVIVSEKDGKIIYKGMEDYEPYKDEPWVYNRLYNYYSLNGMTKKCLNL